MSTGRIVACVVVALLSGAANGAVKSDVADAAMQGNKAAVRALLQQKADVNAAPMAPPRFTERCRPTTPN